MRQGLPVPHLERIRKLRFMTQEQLAVRIGTNQETIHRWETGKTNPRPQSLRKLCEVLDVSPEALAGEDQESRPRRGLSD